MSVEETKQLIRHCKVELVAARRQELTDQLVSSTNEIERVTDMGLKPERTQR